jgi:SAM-dependent methyltransferase
MFATQEEYAYTECMGCGCLAIAAIPADAASHYPADYYSLAQRKPSLGYRIFVGLHFLAPKRMARIRYCTQDLEAVIAAHARFGARVLDVGAGSGRLVQILRALGFKAKGVDMFRDKTNHFVPYDSLDEASGIWDLVMFHHSLEHMTDHIEVLRKVRMLLAPGGTCIVRIPLANWAWRYYGRDWFQLDAPRHYLIHTPASFEIAARAGGFQIAKVLYDSGPGQFIFSEFVRRGIPIFEGKANELFSAETLANFTRQTELLNFCEMGDQASFFLTAV